MPKVKYKYKNESEKVINNADNYKVEPGIVPNSATRWQVYGTYTDASDGNKIKMFTCIDQDTPNINLQERLSYAVLKPNSSNAVDYLTTSPGGGAVEASSVWIVKDDFNGQIRTWIPYATYLQRLAQNPYYPQPGFILGWGGGSYTMYHWDKTTPGFRGGLFIVPNRVYKV